MAEDTPPVDEMHYEVLAQDALRGVIRAALERAASAPTWFEDFVRKVGEPFPA